jgi:hypothetical protein
LFGALLLLQSIQAIQNGSLTPLGWLLTTMVGVGFCLCQVRSGDILFSVVQEEVTFGGAPASIKQEGKEEE